MSKLNTIVYRRAPSVKGALEDLRKARGSKAVLAGGTDLLIELRRQSGPPIRLVDVSQIPQLTGIERRDSEIWIGPLTTMAELASSTLVLEEISVLAQAAASVGSPQIRNLATVGGNLCHASPCADTVPPLIAMDAVLQLQSSRETRVLPVEDFFLGPYRAAIKPDELLVGIQIPVPSSNLRMTFYKLGRRKALSVARLNLVVGLEVNEGIIVNAVLSPGSILPSSARLRGLEKKLMEQHLGEDLFSSIGKEVSELMVREAGERWSTPYKKPVVAAVVARCLKQCLGNNR